MWARIKQLTTLGRHRLSLQKVINDINPLLLGWGRFYRHCYGAKAAFSRINHHVGDRIRRWLRETPRVVRLRGRHRYRGVDQRPVAIVSSLAGHLGNWLRDPLTHQRLSLWSSWLLANVVGGTLSLLLWRVPTEFVGGDLGLLLGILPLAFGQWLALKRYLPPLGWSSLATLEYKAGWVLATTMGVVVGSYLQSVATIGFLSAAVVPSHDLNVVGVSIDAQLLWTRAVGLFALWGVVGAAQWLVFRRYISYASFWIPVSALVGAASGTVELLINTAMPLGGLLLAYIARWSAYGTMTGIALVMLLRDRVRHRMERRLEYLRRPSERGRSTCPP